MLGWRLVGWPSYTKGAPVFTPRSEDVNSYQSPPKFHGTIPSL